MTLAQQDLKAVNKIISQVVNEVVDQKLKKELRPINKDIKEIKQHKD